MAAWDGVAAEALEARLGVPVRLYDAVTSTLDVAHALAEDGAAPGTLVVADRQDAGRGRMGRHWASHAGAGVWCTVVERPTDAAALDVLSLRVGICVAEGLDGIAGARVGVKWPNDLVVAAGKLGGILCEARWSGTSPAWVAIGVGVNVATPGVAGAAGLPPGTRRADVLAAVIEGVRRAAARQGHLDPSELKRFTARDILSGRRLMTPGPGIARGISPSGALLVETPAGLAEYRTGTVQLAEEGDA